MFGGIKNTYKKSEAAAIVQNLLQIRKDEGAYHGEPAADANSLIRAVYERTPERFNGKRGLRPHKLSFAAQGFAYGLSMSAENSRTTLAYLACLEQILQEVEKNQILYPLNKLDQVLLGEAVIALEEKAVAYNESPAGMEINDVLGIKYSTWESWYDSYKNAAGEVRETLPPLIDFMEHTPLKRAFKDGMDPVTLGREFARNFDVTKFGMPP